MVNVLQKIVLIDNSQLTIDKKKLAGQQALRMG
jgi:hypothetical protein